MPPGIVKKRNSYFARIHVRGGEKSFPLGPDPDVAIARFYQVKADLLAGKPAAKPEPEPEADELTVAEAAKRWLSDRIDLELSPRYAIDVRQRTESTLVPFLGDKPLRSLRRADCHGYLAHLRRTRSHLEPSTLCHYLRGLREFLNWCEEVELIDVNPWPPRRIMPRVETKPPKRFTAEEVRTLMGLKEPWGFSLRLALQTGLRWGELVRLERTDLTPDGQLLIRKAKDKEPRTVPVPKALLLEIVARKGRLFATRDGKPYSGQSHRGFNATIRRRSGIEHFHVHTTRHDFSCRFLEAGGELTSLQQILGHSSIRMTQRYGRPGEKAVRADAARVFAAWEALDREQNREQGQIQGLEASGGTC